MAVMGVVVILCVQALVSVAIINYFRTHHAGDAHWWTTTLAPLISVVGQLYVRLPGDQEHRLPGHRTCTGSATCSCIDALVFLGGVAWAFYIKSNDRAKYETIGRLVNEGLDQV